METLSAAEASLRLGIERATLYSYVSRGWLRSLPGSNRRSRRYLSSEVELLQRRAEAARGSGPVAASSLRWGQPVVDTAVGGVIDGVLTIRGRPMEDLVEEGFAATCALLWGGMPTACLLPEAAVLAPGGAGAAAPLRLLAWLAPVAPSWPSGAHESVEHAAGVLHGAAAALALDEGRGHRALRATASSAALGIALGVDDPEEHDLIDAALVLCSEHELNASTFAARVAASTGAPLPAALCAGLAALGGHRHGAAPLEVEAFLDQAAAAPSLGRHLADWRRAGRSVPGLGHPLYPEGDPRFPQLLALARRRPGPALEGVERVIRALRERGQPEPNLNLGLVALRRALGLPRGAAPGLFAVGRMAGWIAHVWEERERGLLIRPRARLVAGPVGITGG